MVFQYDCDGGAATTVVDEGDSSDAELNVRANGVPCVVRMNVRSLTVSAVRNLRRTASPCQCLTIPFLAHPADRRRVAQPVFAYGWRAFGRSNPWLSAPLLFDVALVARLWP